MSQRKKGTEIYKENKNKIMMDIRFRTSWKWYQVLFMIIGLFLLIQGDLVTLFEWLKSVIN